MRIRSFESLSKIFRMFSTIQDVIVKRSDEACFTLAGIDDAERRISSHRMSEKTPPKKKPAQGRLFRVHVLVGGTRFELVTLAV